jgi:hypothetical protein
MTDAPGGKEARVSREELFHRVWAAPMSRLARDYGISGNGLAKICDRLRVPYRPRGYWAKKTAGEKSFSIAFRIAKMGRCGQRQSVPFHLRSPHRKLRPRSSDKLMRRGKLLPFLRGSFDHIRSSGHASRNAKKSGPLAKPIVAHAGVSFPDHNP